MHTSHTYHCHEHDAFAHEYGPDFAACGTECAVYAHLAGASACLEIERAYDAKQKIEHEEDRQSHAAAIAVGNSVLHSHSAEKLGVGRDGFYGVVAGGEFAGSAAAEFVDK